MTFGKLLESSLILNDLEKTVIRQIWRLLPLDLKIKLKSILIDEFHLRENLVNNVDKKLIEKMLIKKMKSLKESINLVEKKSIKNDKKELQNIDLLIDEL